MDVPFEDVGMLQWHQVIYSITDYHSYQQTMRLGGGERRSSHVHPRDSLPLCPEGGVLHVCGRCPHFILGVVYTVRGYESLVTSNFIL